MKIIYSKYLLSTIIAIVFICYSLAGITNVNYLYISFGLLTIWIIISYISDKKSFTAMLNKKKYFYFFLFMFYLLLSSLINSSLINIFKNLGEALVHFSPIFILSYYLQAKQITIIKKIIIISGLFYLFICLLALILYSNNPDAARIIASDRYALDSIVIGGGYGLAYGSAILTVYFFDVYRSKILKTKTHNFFLLIIIIFLSILVISTRSTITILVMFFGFFLSILFMQTPKSFNGSKSNNLFLIKKIIIIFLLIFSIFFLLEFKKEVGSSIINIFSDSDNIVFKRIQEIGFLMVDDNLDDEGTMAVRFELMQQSISTFINSPIFGQGWEFGNLFELSKNYVGNHSEWFDTLGKFGLLGGIPFFLTFMSALKEDKIKTGKFIPPTYIIVFFFLGLFNPFRSFQSMYTLFFIIPSIGLLFFRKNQI